MGVDDIQISIMNFQSAGVKLQGIRKRREAALGVVELQIGVDLPGLMRPRLAEDVAGKAPVEFRELTVAVGIEQLQGALCVRRQRRAHRRVAGDIRSLHLQ